MEARVSCVRRPVETVASSAAPTSACPRSVWTRAKNSETILQGTVKTGLLLSGVYHTCSFSSIRYRSFSGRVCSPTKLSLICLKKGSVFCCLINSDISVSALKARSMADAVSPETVAVVDEVVISPPANRTSSTLGVVE